MGALERRRGDRLVPEPATAQGRGQGQPPEAVATGAPLATSTGVVVLAEPGDRQGADDHAVERERQEGPGREVTGQETDRQVGGQPGRDAPDEDLGPHPISGPSRSGSL